MGTWIMIILNLIPGLWLSLTWSLDYDYLKLDHWVMIILHWFLDYEYLNLDPLIMINLVYALW